MPMFRDTDMNLSHRDLVLENWKRDAQDSDRVICPKCDCHTFHVFWQDPPIGAGGRLTLYCMNCGHKWVEYDDYA
jgi:peptide methionine sulfoxide reductase MsrB